MATKYSKAMIVGSGSGLSASLTHHFAREVFKVALAARNTEKLAPMGIHVAHFVIDGAIRNPGRTEPLDNPDSLLDPDAIAANYLHVLRQPRSAWT